MPPPQREIRGRVQSGRCVYLEARVPFVLEQPAATGVKVLFNDATAAAFGANAQNYRAPVGIVDIDQRGKNDLFCAGWGRISVAHQLQRRLPRAGTETARASPEPNHTRCLVGDINNDRFEDVVEMSEAGVQIFKGATNGVFTDATAFAA